MSGRETYMRIVHKIKWKSLILYLSTIAVSVLLLFIGNRLATKNLLIFNSKLDGLIIEKARVTELTGEEYEEYENGSGSMVKNVQIFFNAVILKGEDKGKTVSGIQAVQRIDDVTNPLSPEIAPGDKLLIRFIEGQTSEKWQFMQFVRTDKLLILGLLFILALLIFGRIKGFNTIISLAFTCTAIFLVFIPSILNGINIYLTSILICIYTTVMTFLIINGGNKKTLAATLGCFSGVAIAGVLTFIMDYVLKITGFIDEASLELTYLATVSPINLRAIIFAAILLGSLGAIMDVAMSIASALWELKEASGSSFKELFKSGINIGKDIMGTMVNTLILAYIGSSLSTVLILNTTSFSLSYLLNREVIIVEILQALVGSFGLLATLPLASLISAVLYTRKHFNKRHKI
jgi:uncharacterized membrane protein